MAASKELTIDPTCCRKDKVNGTELSGKFTINASAAIDACKVSSGMVFTNNFSSVGLDSANRSAAVNDHIDIARPGNDSTLYTH
ncbi:MAG: hypothetical protein MUO70_01120, partial [Euryarchaeota archaeon]|nr:hypothetical protein [Euryarchaeota archaeon]